MKKLISLVLAAVMALSLVACGSGNKDKDTGDKTYKAVSYTHLDVYKRQAWTS